MVLFGKVEDFHEAKTKFNSLQIQGSQTKLACWAVQGLPSPQAWGPLYGLDGRGGFRAHRQRQLLHSTSPTFWSLRSPTGDVY